MLIAVVALSSGAAPAQPLPQWQTGFHLRGIAGDIALGNVRATAIYDGGAPDDPRLYIAGNFNAVGATPAANIARLSGCAWEPVGGGLNGEVAAITVFDDGSGPTLVAVGGFTQAGGLPAVRAARYNGAAWSALGTGLPAILPAAAYVFQGSLYVGGMADNSMYPPQPALARWNGQSWQTVPFIGVQLPINALAEADLGAGPQLIAGTGYDFFPTSVGHVYKLAGNTWTLVPNADFSWAVRTLTFFDDGSGRKLYAGGSFSDGSPTSGLARLNGSSWEPVGVGRVTGQYTEVRQLRAIDDAGGPHLYAAGVFDSIGGVGAAGVARWNGTAWTPVSSGTLDGVSTLENLPNHTLFAGGPFASIGGVAASGIAMFHNQQWQPMINSGEGLSYPSFSMTTFAPPGAAAVLYANGEPNSLRRSFSAGNITNAYFYAWDGHSWSAFAPPGHAPDRYGSAFEVFHHSPDQDILYYVEELHDNPNTTSIVRWNGSAPVEHLGDGTNGFVRALKAIDSTPSPTLYAGGSVSQIGGASGPGVFRYQGGSWSSVPGLSICTPSSITISAFEYFDDGSGPALFVAGQFQGTIGCAGVAKRVGTSWVVIGNLSGGLNAAANDLIVWNDGSGPALFATGAFTNGSGHVVNNIAKWNGQQWLPLGAGLSDGNLTGGLGNALAVFDDGSGPALFVGGNFTSVGGVAVSNLAKWNGSTWSAPVGGGTDLPISRLAVHDDGFGPALFASGAFTRAGDTVSVRFAKYGVTPAACAADFNRDGTLNYQDFCDFLGAFFGATPGADFDHDNTVNSNDFFEYLAAFFAGCG